MGFHANTAAVNCLSCHSIHKAAPKSTHLLASEPGKLCATCHLPETASFQNKPYAHRLDRGGMTCLDCHDPHARAGEPVKMTVQGELPCLSCHADLRGPFVFQHVTGSGGDCLSCHQPHGSNNPNMLQWARVDQLCLSCHSQTGGPKTLRLAAAVLPRPDPAALPQLHDVPRRGARLEPVAAAAEMMHEERKRSSSAAGLLSAAGLRAQSAFPVDVELGYRFVDVTGNDQMYRTQINDRPGLLLRSLDYTSPEPRSASSIPSTSTARTSAPAPPASSACRRSARTSSS